MGFSKAGRDAMRSLRDLQKPQMVVIDWDAALAEASR